MVCDSVVIKATEDMHVLLLQPYMINIFSFPEEITNQNITTFSYTDFSLHDDILIHVVYMFVQCSLIYK